MSASNQAVLDYLSSSPNLSDADIYSFMQSKGVPASQMAAVTGIPLSDITSRVSAVAPTSNTLGGIILAGDSWLSGADKTAIANEAFGQNVSNVAIGGSTTKDVLNQLNSFINNGGNFQNGTTVVLDVGGNDLLTGVNKDTIKSNLNNIVSTLGKEGVNVILSGAPNVSSVSDVTSSTQLAMDNLYNDVAKNNSNVKVVDSMSGLLNQKQYVDETGFHVNAEGQTKFINDLASAAKELNQPTTSTATPTNNVVDKLKQQILAQGTASKWSGEGFGSAEANAADMARILAQTGITDISQFGQVQKTIPAQEQQVELGDGFTTIIVPEHTVTTFGNKLTGQEVPNTYSERQTGNFFGGTFAGKGNTGYGVQFDAQGNPLFYTQGASSKDTSLLPLLQIGLMATGAGGLLGNALLGTGASQIAAGALGGGLIGGATNALAGGNFFKGAALGAAGGALGGYIDGSGSSVPSLDAADTAGGLIPKYGTSYDDWMQLVMDNPEAQQALLNAINGTQVASTTPVTTPTTTDGLFNVPSAGTVNITGSNVPTQLSPDIFSAITSQLSNNLTATTPNVEVTAQNPNKAVVPSIFPINSNLTTTNVVPNVEVTGTTDNNKVTTPVVTLPSGTTTTTTTSGNNTTDLTDDQKINLAKAGLSLVNLLGGGAVVGGLLGGGGTGTFNVGALPTQGIPLNSDDYFNAIQRNYNALLPAVPRDVASPLRSWYTSQYGA